MGPLALLVACASQPSAGSYGVRQPLDAALRQAVFLLPDASPGVVVLGEDHSSPLGGLLAREVLRIRRPDCFFIEWPETTQVSLDAFQDDLRLLPCLPLKHGDCATLTVAHLGALMTARSLGISVFAVDAVPDEILSSIEGGEGRHGAVSRDLLVRIITDRNAIMANNVDWFQGAGLCTTSLMLVGAGHVRRDRFGRGPTLVEHLGILGTPAVGVLIWGESHLNQVNNDVWVDVLPPRKDVRFWTLRVD